VLTRRILQLKVQKGFAINQEEAEKNMKTNMKLYATQVSTALSNNVEGNSNALAGLDLDGGQGLNANNFKTGGLLSARGGNQNQPAEEVKDFQNSSNLLDVLDGGPPIQEEAAQIDTMAALQDVLGGVQAPYQEAEPYPLGMGQ
jgi:hypothetical protein